MLKDILDKLKGLIRQLKYIIVEKNENTQANLHLYETAKKHLGQDVTPKDEVDDDVACASSYNKIVSLAFGSPAGGEASTWWLLKALEASDKYAEVAIPIEGDTLIAATGTGGSSSVKNGHVAICLEEGKLASNSSDTGLWVQNYNLYTFNYRYNTLGRFPVRIFRRVFF